MVIKIKIELDISQRGRRRSKKVGDKLMSEKDDTTNDPELQLLMCSCALPTMVTLITNPNGDKRHFSDPQDLMKQATLYGEIKKLKKSDLLRIHN